MNNRTDDLPLQLQGLRTVMDDYDGVILDLWGVVHNGVSVFPHTLPALRALKAAGKKIWLLSNAPRRAARVREHLAILGVTTDMYDGVMTSGEASYLALRDGLLSVWGPRCLMLGESYGADLLAGLPVMPVHNVADADFVLATGVPGGTLEANRAVLSQACAQGLPLLCANPDRVVHVGDDLYLCPGTLADHYEGLGGAVTWFGKPHAAVYDAVLAAMGSRQVLALGDGMQTDVKGAVAAGIDVALVTLGIHREALHGADTASSTMGQEAIAQNRLMALIAAEGVKPSFVINGLIW